MPKPRYKTTNGKHYNQALINRGSLTFWIDEEARSLEKAASSRRHQHSRDSSSRTEFIYVTDAEVLPNLLKQTRRRIIEISGDGAYDTRRCHDAIRIKLAVPLIPPREGADFWEQEHPRNRELGHLMVSATHLKHANLFFHSQSAFIYPNVTRQNTSLSLIYFELVGSSVL